MSRKMRVDRVKNCLPLCIRFPFQYSSFAFGLSLLCLSCSKHLAALYPYEQGWEESRYSLDRAWIEAIFWLGIGVGEPIFVYLMHKRHFLLITKDTLCVSQEPRYSIGVGIADTDSLYREQPY